MVKTGTHELETQFTAQSPRHGKATVPQAGPKASDKNRNFRHLPRTASISTEDSQGRVWIPEQVTVGRLEVAGPVFPSSPYFPIFVMNLALSESGTLSHPLVRGLS